VKRCIDYYYTDNWYRTKGDLIDNRGLEGAGATSVITHVKFVGIPTADQQRSLKFYTEKMGFEVSTDQPFDDKQRWIELRIANSPTRFVLFTPEGHENRIGTFFNGSLACDDVTATYRQLSARGVEFVKPPEKQPWGEFAIFKDPDGNQFVLSST
jgi:predicted enzyme related to lactoylglutathione lyase